MFTTKLTYLTAALSIALTVNIACAQVVSTNPMRRASAPQPPEPEIAADGKVTFRLRNAGNANEVQVTGQFGPKATLTRGSNNTWSVTVGPIQPGVYEYSFVVDGMNMIDPGNTLIKPMREPRTSILHVPGNPPLIHDFQNVPHGVVRQHTYFSRPLGRLRELCVYTPPGYDMNTSRKYPVFYLQHGSGDNQATWVAHGKAHWILDNLISQGRAKPMIVVMMDGHANPVSDSPAAALSGTQAFERDMFDEVIPFVEREYRVKLGAANRAITGLSMGGGQSLTIGLNHLDTFAWVGGFSSSAPTSDAVATALSHPQATNLKLKLLWIACGDRDFLLKRNQDFIAALKEKGIRHEWLLSDGDHSWPIWRRYLAELAPKLFQ